MRFQLKLSNLLLLTTVAALSVLLWLQRSRNRAYEDRLPGLRNAARELVITDPQLVHAVKPHREWIDEKTWEIYVPASGTYHLNLATEGLPEYWNLTRGKDFPNAASSVRPAPGKHRVELFQRKGDVIETEVLLDGESVILLKKSPNGAPQNTGTTSSSDVGNSRSFPPGKEVRLLHSWSGKPSGKRAGTSSQSTSDQGNGILLWISGS